MNNKLRGYLAMIGVLTAWGSSYSISKVAMYYMSPFVLTMYRFAIGGLVLALVGRGLIINRKYVINALLNGALFVVFLNIAIQYSTNPALVSVLVYTQPIFVLILSIVLYHEKPRALQVIGIALAFTGLLIAVGVYSFDIGDAIALLGAFTWAVGTHYFRRNLVNEDLIKLNASMSIISALIASPVLIINPYMSLSVNAVVWGVLVALVAQVAGFLFWFLGVRDLGPITASSISILVPASAYIFALLILGKVPTMTEIIGSAIALIGVLVSQLRA
ncbi:DMT family transporter [Vulcanisaeta sp. JCM 14467]|uniref:DMT family transporter n=1 Tax=Vulcanisaeta sp. JCM 14467 TaxID=1295370 RepID=UPI0006D10648|nr:DMT family transporter [Vulcanisaeta sp. JCM 14467]